MGISHNSQRYQKNDVLFISDDLSYTTHYIYGRAPQNNDEIAVPLSTARKLAQRIRSIHYLIQLGQSIISIN